MRVLHIAGGSSVGGAALGCILLHRALRKLGCDSHVIFGEGESNVEEQVYCLSDSPLNSLEIKAHRKLSRLFLLRYPHASKGNYSAHLGGGSLLHMLERIQPDIVNLQWVGRSVMSLYLLSHLRCPVVWTLRDFWPFTGGCYYPIGCNQYKIGCGTCPILRSSLKNDLSAQHFRKKREILQKSNVHFVAISNWLADRARQSKLIAGLDVEVIPNGCDFPMPPAKGLSELDKKIAAAIGSRQGVLSVGAYALYDEYKGGAVLEPIIKDLAKDFLILAFGGGSERLAAAVPGVLSLGFILDRGQLRGVYEASDVFLCLSREEAFGKTVVEALSCGAGVVCFNSGGPAEIISDSRVGRIADYPSVKGFCAAVRDLVTVRNESTDNFSSDALLLASAFNITNTADKYIKTYNRLLNGL